MKKIYMKRLFLLFTCFFSLHSFAQDIDVLHYNFYIYLNDKSDTLQGQTIIRLIKLTDAAKISLDLTSVNNSGKGMKVMKVTELIKGKTNELSFSHLNEKLQIDLNKRKGDTAVILIDYSGIPSDGLIISKNKFGDRTFFADNWPNRAHHWIPCNDRPDDKATFEFVVNVPEHYFVISNGLQKDITVNNKVEGKEYVYAGEKMVHWKEDIALPTKVMVIGAAPFAIKEYQNSPNKIPISAWVYPQDSTKGFYDFAVAPDIVRYFSDYIAPFPYQKLANVQSTTIFGGMENASCIFYAEDLVTGDRRHEDVVAHEIAHQWFGDMASEKSFAHLWLSEGFAVYFTDLWFEYKYGKDSAKSRLKKEREQVINFTKKSDHAVVDSTNKLMSLLNPNSYQKGGWILHMIRNEVGDSTFKKIIQTYYNRYKGSNAETRDFQNVVETVTGKNWKAFFDQWLYRPRIPQLIIDKKIENDEVKLRITQQGVKFDFPLEVCFVRADGSLLKETIAVNSQMIDYKIKVPDVKTVIIDPDTKLLYAEVK